MHVWGMMSRALRSAFFFALAVAVAVSFPANAGDGPRDEVRRRLLDRINADRADAGLEPVKIDLDASAVADRYCGLQIEAGTRGHVSLDGMSPFMRYSRARIEGHVLENLAAWSSREVIPLELIPKMAERSHEEMISEVPPDDGHRRAILDPWVNHVGIGVAWGGGEVRVAEVFFRRYLEWTRVDRRVEPGKTSSYRGRLLDPESRVERVTVHYEPFPYRLSRERANRVESYALPDEWIRLEQKREPSPLDAAIRHDGGEKPRFSVDGDELSFDVPYSNGRGIYTIVVWVRPPGSSSSVPATNLAVVVEVDRRGGETGF